MQPGSQKQQSELNMVEDAAGDERWSVPTAIFHKQAPSDLYAGLAASLTVCNFGMIVTNSTSHALKASEATV